MKFSFIIKIILASFVSMVILDATADNNPPQPQYIFPFAALSTVINTPSPGGNTYNPITNPFFAWMPTAGSNFTPVVSSPDEFNFIPIYITCNAYSSCLLAGAYAGESFIALSIGNKSQNFNPPCMPVKHSYPVICDASTLRFMKKNGELYPNAIQSVSWNQPNIKLEPNWWNKAENLSADISLNVNGVVPTTRTGITFFTPIPIGQPVAIIYVSKAFLSDPDAIIRYNDGVPDNLPGVDKRYLCQNCDAGESFDILKHTNNGGTVEPSYLAPSERPNCTPDCSSPYSYTGSIWQSVFSENLGVGGIINVSKQTSSETSISHNQQSVFSVSVGESLKVGFPKSNAAETTSVTMSKSWISGVTNTTSQIFTTFVNPSCNNQYLQNPTFCQIWNQYLTTLVNIPGMAEIFLNTDGKIIYYDIFKNPGGDVPYNNPSYSSLGFNVSNTTGLETAPFVSDPHSTKIGPQIPIGTKIGVNYLNKFTPQNPTDYPYAVNGAVTNTEIK